MTSIPQKLYKYQGNPHRDIGTLRDGNSYYSSPEQLNDPFDCQITMDSTDIDESDMIPIALNLMESALKQTGTEITFSTDEDYPIRQRFDYLCEDFLTCFFRYGIYSLSEDPLQPLMWSHYASRFEGFVLEYDTTAPSMEGVTKSTFPVEYTREVPFFLFRDILNEERFAAAKNRLLTTKSTHWSYEREWRVIIWPGGRVFRAPFSISRVIFGHLLDNEYRKELRRHFGDSVSYSVAAPAELNYGVELHDATTGRSRQRSLGLVRPHRKRGTYYYNVWRDEEG